MGNTWWSPLQRAACVLIVLSIASAFPPLAAQATPPVTGAQVAAAVAAAGGPNFGDLFRAAPVDPNDPPGANPEYYAGVDGEGRPVSNPPPPHTHIFEVRLSYVPDGSGGYCWFASLEVWKRTGRYWELTNAATNMMSSEQLEKLLAGRHDWGAFNDPETVKRYDAQLDRTPQAAIGTAFRRLNAGMTGAVRVQIPVK